MMAYTLLILLAMAFFKEAFAGLVDSVRIAKKDSRPLGCVILGLIGFVINSTIALVIIEYALNFATDGDWSRYVRY